MNPAAPEKRRKGRRRGGRRSGQKPELSATGRSRSYRTLRHPFQPQSVLSEDAIANIHQMAIRVLKELGIKILLPEARIIFERAGALVNHNTEMVHLDEDLISEALEHVPAIIRFRARSPDRELTIDGKSLVFYPGAGCPNVVDHERGRLPGSLKAYQETIKLQQAFDVIHMFGPSAEPQDIPVRFRHYEMMRTQLIYGDKPMFVYARGRQQTEESFELIKLGCGLSDEEFQNNIWSLTVINTNSPRQIDIPMAKGIIDFARHGQLSVITPFCLAGAMAPVTLTGTLVLQHAEVLASLSLGQLAKRGAPMMVGGFSSNVDMKSGSPAFGTPEHIKLTIATGQLARHIGIPWRSASGAASNVADMQSANETIMTLWAALQANANLVVHAAGWLEGGLSFGYEKFINDIESLQTLAELCIAIPEDEDSFGWSALSDVEPGGHFFATPHTMERYKDAFYRPLVADLSNYGTWSDAGSKTSTERATAIWKQVLADFKPPLECKDINERISGQIERWKSAGGAQPDG